mgnify:CR=1 FL=1
MATAKIGYEKPSSSVFYWDEAAPGVRYEVSIGSGRAANIQAAIQGHINQRKAAGIYFAGKSDTGPATVTVTV